MRYMECRHIKPNGCKCQSPSLRGQPYCYFHIGLHRKLHRGPAAAAASAPTSSPSSDAILDIPFVEDRTAIQMALTQVLQNLGTRSIDPRRAGQLLYGLQIASQLVDDSFISQTQYVQTVNLTDDGAELGPEAFGCTGDEECDQCPYAVPGKCDRWHCGGDDDDEEEEEEEEEEKEVHNELDDELAAFEAAERAITKAVNQTPRR
jgi:hypothetical protein